MADISLVFHDGQEERVVAQPGETVLAAALRAGARPVLQCESGSCGSRGTCVVKVTYGAVETLPGRAPALPDGKLQDGLRLACSVRPDSDCTVALDYPRSLITGLAPLLSMLDVVRERAGPPPEIVPGFGCNTIEDMFCLDELELRAFWMPSLTVRTAVVTEPKGAYDGRVGDAASLIEPGDLEAPGLTAYLCSPPAMIDAGRKRLLDGGLAPERIRAEQFRPNEA